MRNDHTPSQAHTGRTRRLLTGILTICLLLTGCFISARTASAHTNSEAEQVVRDFYAAYLKASQHNDSRDKLLEDTRELMDPVLTAAIKDIDTREFPHCWEIDPFGGEQMGVSDLRSCQEHSSKAGSYVLTTLVLGGDPTLVRTYKVFLAPIGGKLRIVNLVFIGQPDFNLRTCIKEKNAEWANR